MWSDNPSSVYAVLALAVFLGKVIQAVSGFGGGILVLCVWVLFKVAGVYSGSLQQAVVCSSLSGALMVPAMLYITRARHTADARLATTIIVFTSLGSPIGAAILAHLNNQQVQIFMGCAVLLFILLEQLAQHMQLLVFRKRLPRIPSVTGLVMQGIEGSLALGGKPEYVEYAALTAAAAAAAAAAAGPAMAPWSGYGLGNSTTAAAAAGKREWGSRFDQMKVVSNNMDEIVVICDGQPAAAAAAAPAASPAAAAASPAPAAAVGLEYGGDDADCSSSTTTTSSSSSSGWDEDSNSLHEPLLPISTSSPAAAGNQAAAAAVAGEQQLLMDLKQQVAIHSSRDNSGSSGSGSSSSSDSRHSWLKIVGVGSVAATVGGIMGSLTGAGGPPLMILYRLLKTPKDTVRGTNAVTSLFQVKLIPYYYLGLIRAADTELYLVTCAAAVVGVWVGNSLAGKLNQQGFQRVLLGLMVVCAGLMFVSGFGLLQS